MLNRSIGEEGEEAQSYLASSQKGGGVADSLKAELQSQIRPGFKFCCHHLQVVGPWASQLISWCQIEIRGHCED